MEHIKTTIAGIAVASLLTAGATALTPSAPDHTSDLDRQASHVQEGEKKRFRQEGTRLLDANLKDELRPRLVIRP